MEAGLARVSRPEAARRSLDSLLEMVRVWPIEREVSLIYGQIHRDLRRRGHALSQVDIMLAALARSMDLTLLTTDRDFEALPDLRVEDWTTALAGS